MFTQPQTIEEKKQLFTEELINNSPNITDVSDHSTNSGIGYGVSKVSQKCDKDLALIESNLMPESAVDTDLDKVAVRMGVSARFGAFASSGWVRITASPGTVYTQANNPKSSSGKIFQLDSGFTMGVMGFAYIHCTCTTTGSNTNCEAGSISSIDPAPSGHISITNECLFEFGADDESDYLFRQRIMSGANILGRGTLDYLTQVYMKINPLVLRVIHNGRNSSGQNQLSVLTVNGSLLSTNDLLDLKTQSAAYISLADLKYYSDNNDTISLNNADFYYYDILFRVQLDSSVNIDDIRRDIQIKIMKYFDFRSWDSWSIISVDKIISIIETTYGVQYIPSQYFYPVNDVVVPKNTFPVLRSFVMQDLNGNILSNISGTISPVYYPNNIDINFMTSVLKNI